MNQRSSDPLGFPSRFSQPRKEPAGAVEQHPVLASKMEVVAPHRNRLENAGRNQRRFELQGRIRAISPLSIVTRKSQADANSPMAAEPPYFCHVARFGAQVVSGLFEIAAERLIALLWLGEEP